MMIQVYKPGNRNFDYNGDYNLKPITCELKMKLKGEWVVTLRNPLDGYCRKCHPMHGHSHRQAAVIYDQ
jgi:hypothetical protein